MIRRCIFGFECALPTSAHITYSQSKLFYSKAGRGKKNLLLFHGFGQDHRVFHSWAEVLQNEYTLFSFDLFFHGQSSWTSRGAMEKKDWTEIVGLFLSKENIKEFEVVGFSLGGKFALATLEAFPHQLKKITLLAPDGIKTSFWYSLATYPIAIRALFKSMILHPDRLYKTTKVMRKLRLVDKGILRFAESQMDTEEKRRRVYLSWVYFRHLKFDLKKIAQLINSNTIETKIRVGKYDKVIQAKNLKRLVMLLPHADFKVVDAGHNDLITSTKNVLGN
jgi:pimeloyl-ACP methyl ester carboxylesterase